MQASTAAGGEASGSDPLVVRFPRYPLGSAYGVLQVLGAAFFSAYFFFWLIGLSVMIALVSYRILSIPVAATLIFFYLASIALYKPQLHRGWPFHWFLYSHLVDLVLGYYDATAVREGPPLDASGRYLFAMAPHGIFGVCRAFSGGSLWRRLYPGMSARWGSFAGAFVIPGVREFSLCCGCLDASAAVLERAVARGENVMLLPGGIKEMMLTDGRAAVTKLSILDRKGFVRLAVRNGLSLVPGFCFGEKWVHDIALLPKWARLLMYRRKLAGTLLRGRWFTFLGKVERLDGSPLSLGFVWGAPIQVPHDPSCPDDVVDRVHKEFLAATLDIFERYKRRFGYAEEAPLLVSARCHLITGTLLAQPLVASAVRAYLAYS